MFALFDDRISAGKHKWWAECREDDADAEQNMRGGTNVTAGGTAQTQYGAVDSRKQVA